MKLNTKTKEALFDASFLFGKFYFKLTNYGPTPDSVSVELGWESLPGILKKLNISTIEMMTKMIVAPIIIKVPLEIGVLGLVILSIIFPSLNTF